MQDCPGFGALQFHRPWHVADAFAEISEEFSGWIGQIQVVRSRLIDRRAQKALEAEYFLQLRYLPEWRGLLTAREFNQSRTGADDPFGAVQRW